jgi:hypothetical protein
LPCEGASIKEVGKIEQAAKDHGFDDAYIRELETFLR